MKETKKFVVVKQAKKKTITVEAFERLKGYSLSPKKDFKYDDMIKVTKVTIDNPELIKAFVEKKCKRNMDKILTILSLVSDNDDATDGSPLMLALNEIEKFRQLLIYKYQEYLSSKEYHKLLKKLEILSEEIKLRINLKLYEESEEYKSERGSR